MKQIPATAANARILSPFIKLSSMVRLSSIVVMVVYLPTHRHNVQDWDVGACSGQCHQQRDR